MEPKNKEKEATSSKLDEDNSKLPFWTTRIMAENFGREAILEATLRETIIYLVFVFLVTVVCIGMTSQSMYYLTRVMEEQFLERDFSTVNDEKITFKQVRTAADFWHYAESVLFDSFYWDYWYDSNNPIEETDDDDKKILYQNKLLGVPRFRQLKVRNDSCVVHPILRRIFLSCYAPYSQQAEDRSSFGLQNGTAWSYSTSEKTGSITHWGKVSTYDGGGFYQELTLNRNNTKEVIEKLKEKLWITRGTRVIFLDFTVYNANVNLFCIMRLIFEFPATGGIIPSHSFDSVKIIRYVTIWDHFVMGCEILFVCFIIFYTMEEIREFAYLKWSYFKHFWNYIDLIILCLAYCCIIFTIIRAVHASHVLKKLKKVEEEIHINFEVIGAWQSHFNCVSAILLFFVYIKIFKYLNFNRTMGQLNNTFKKCALDILGFSIMFFIIFFAFAVLGYLLFGTQVESFSGFGIAMFTLLRTILGDFDYTEIEAANKILAPIYFISYIFFVFFVLLNMFLAIINDTYTDVKTELALSPDEMQMGEFIKRGFYNLLKKCGCKKWVPPEKEQKNEYSITIEKIRGLLKTCGFTDMEIEMFFARYDINPALEIGEFDINKLMADLEEKPESKGRSFSSKGDINEHSINYAVQDERLDEMEKTINLLANKLDALLKKLDTLENVKKTPKRN